MSIIKTVPQLVEMKRNHENELVKVRDLLKKESTRRGIPRNMEKRVEEEIARFEREIVDVQAKCPHTHTHDELVWQDTKTRGSHNKLVPVSVCDECLKKRVPKGVHHKPM